MKLTSFFLTLICAFSLITPTLQAHGGRGCCGSSSGGVRSPLVAANMNLYSFLTRNWQIIAFTSFVMAPIQELWVAKVKAWVKIAQDKYRNQSEEVICCEDTCECEGCHEDEH